MVTIKTGKFLHHLDLASFDRRVTQIIVLVLRPSRAHEHLHAMFGSLVHNGIHRTLPVCRIVPVHQLGRIVCLALVCHRHEHEVLHAHLTHLGNLGRPHLRICAIDALRIGVLVTHILIRQIDECSCHGKGLRKGSHSSPQQQKCQKYGLSHILFCLIPQIYGIIDTLHNIFDIVLFRQNS